MTLLQSLLHLTNFKSPLLSTLVPSVSAAFAIQAAFAIPSIACQSERFYDFSGSLTYIAVTTLSLYLPALRARHAAAQLNIPLPPLPSLLSAFRSGTLTPGGAPAFNWRQVVLSGAVSLWAARLGTYLFTRVLSEGTDSRFDKIKRSPARFAVAFAVQATWVSLCLMPVLAINAVPATAFASSAFSGMKLTDMLGLGLYIGGIAFETVADRQKARWAREKRDKLHDEVFLTKGLWGVSRHPNYFGESTLWTGIATTAAGVLMAGHVRQVLGVSAAGAAAMCAVSPGFVTFLLLKVSGVPLSEKKYDGKYGGRADYQEWKRNTPKFFPKLW